MVYKATSTFIYFVHLFCLRQGLTTDQAGFRLTRDLPPKCSNQRAYTTKLHSAFIFLVEIGSRRDGLLGEVLMT